MKIDKEIHQRIRNDFINIRRYNNTPNGIGKRLWSIILLLRIAPVNHMTDPARILPLYTAQPHNSVPQTSSIVSPLVRRNKAHVASACVNCKKAHLACDGKFPHPFCPITSIYGCNVSPFLRYQAAISRCGMWMHVKQRLRAAPMIFGFSFLFVYVLLAFFVFSFLLCVVPKWGTGPGLEGPVSGRAFFHRLHCAHF